MNAEVQADTLGKKLDSVSDNTEEAQKGIDEFGQKLEQDKRQREHDRDQGAKDIVSQSLRGVVRVIANVVVVAIAAIAWHYLLPPWLTWLSDKQLSGLLAFLLSSIVIGSVSNFFRQHA